jgi:hypothetical protein
MKVEKVSWSGHIPYASFLNHRPGFDAFLEEGEDPIEALLKLKALADQFHKLAYPPQQDDESIHSSQIENQEPKELQMDKIEDGIRTCKEIKVLETYRFIIKKYPRLQKAYDEMMEKLTLK